MKTLLGALTFVGIAVLVVLVFGSDQRSTRNDGNLGGKEPREEMQQQPEVTHTVRQPDSAAPAAGVCDGVPDPIVSVAITEDIPSPRCVKVTQGQRVRVENRTMERITIFFDGTSDPTAADVYAIVPGDAVLIDAPVETYLAFGVHHLNISGYSSPEIWFEDVP